VSVNSDLDLLSIVDFQRHELWFSGGNGIFRFAALGISLSTDHRGAPLDYASIGRSDGLNSTQCSIGAPNMAITRDGKLWVATVQGLALLDLPRLRHTNRKAAIYVEEVTVGQKKAPVHHELVLPPGTQHLELKFDAIELASPEKIRFQYWLDGVDPAWLDADTTRTAVYTSIPAGAHSFHIRACDSNGVWDRDGIVYSVTQQPFFYETGLFRFLCAGLGVLIVWMIYRLRVRQIIAGINARFDDRLAERTRLAREFHDTLLQTIQGSKMVADDALDEPADPVRMRRALERLSGWLALASQEGRAALSSLRIAMTQRNDLAEALRRVTEDGLIPSSMAVTFSVVGDAREMHPIVRDEIYRIGYEAIRNACTHSAASRLEVELGYASNLFVRVRDNGTGIDPVIADRGKDGHFGLLGMRERTARIGGKLTLVSSSSSGTEIKLIVPGGMIFGKMMPDRSLLARIRTCFRLKDKTSNID
jgi:hypothetical protein